ncbi:MAG: MGH1-like glycoside hydrolase domain-containing protein [Solirubrobacteraceae bacterium]|nr:MAG: hypothetical protein DLM63_10605 [Solirubrobacterales bacterium]
MTLPDLSPPGEDVATLCERTLRGSWVTGLRADVPFAYTRPSPGRYPWQWYWDSCFAAIVWRRFDRLRARLELETLLSAARADGFIGHTIFWHAPVTRTRRVYNNVLSRNDPMTSTIAPPLLAWAWRIAVGDPASEPAVVAHHDQVQSDRDLEGDGLLWLLQPDESGLDASPQFDPIWGARAQGTLGFPLLVARNRRLGFRIRAVREAGGPLVCEVLTNVLHGLSQLALGRRSITAALVDRLYDESRGVFVLERWPSPARPIPLTWSALAPLALPDLPEAIGRRLVEEHLLDPARFWSAVAPPSVASDEPSFSLRERFWGLRRYWRGPTWVNAAWLVWLGLVRLGYKTEASTLADGIVGAVRGAGLRECYNPRDGRGMGARDFAWSALALELAVPDPLAASSHIVLPVS